MKEVLGGIGVMSDQEDYKYYLAMTDGEVWNKIANLTSYQRKKFDEAMILTGSFRKSLFVSSSYPVDIKEGK